MKAKYAGTLRAVCRYGADILASPGMRMSRRFVQHGRVSVYAHSLSVAVVCLALARALRLRVNEPALVRGALLHDYFLYDWHERDASHRWHGFHHARRALENAERDFALTDIERNMIASHMFPLSWPAPRRRESALLYAADKLCTLREMLGRSG